MYVHASKNIILVQHAAIDTYTTPDVSLRHTPAQNREKKTYLHGITHIHVNKFNFRG